MSIKEVQLKNIKVDDHIIKYYDGEILTIRVNRVDALYDGSIISIGLDHPDPNYETFTDDYDKVLKVIS